MSHRKRVRQWFDGTRSKVNFFFIYFFLFFCYVPFAVSVLFADWFELAISKSCGAQDVQNVAVIVIVIVRRISDWRERCRVKHVWDDGRRYSRCLPVPVSCQGRVLLERHTRLPRCTRVPTTETVAASSVRGDSERANIYPHHARVSRSGEKRRYGFPKNCRHRSGARRRGEGGGTRQGTRETRSPDLSRPTFAAPSRHALLPPPSSSSSPPSCSSTASAATALPHPRSCTLAYICRPDNKSRCYFNRRGQNNPTSFLWFSFANGTMNEL